MSMWIKLNNNVPRHPRVAGLSDRAFRYWITSLCYASEFLTDGALPAAFLDTVPLRVGRELQASGLWIRIPDGVIIIRDYLEHQLSKTQVIQKKTEASGRVARHRKRKSNAVGNALQHTFGNAVSNALVTDLDIDIDTDQIPPKSPPGGGDVRIRREHKEQARAIWRSRLGYCEHEPRCPNQVHCTDRIAEEVARKAVAS